MMLKLVIHSTLISKIQVLCTEIHIVLIVKNVHEKSLSSNNFDSFVTNP